MREATEADIPRLVEMGREFHAAKQKLYQFDADDTGAFFRSVISGGVVFIAPRGFLAGVISGAPSNQSYRTAFELFWWSQGRDGLALKRAFESWAAENGCQEIKFSHPSAEAGVQRLLERDGYEASEIVLRRNA